MPPLRSGPKEHGWLIIDGEQWHINNWHHFADFGQSIETVRAKSPAGKWVEVYSLDDGLTWISELD